MELGSFLFLIIQIVKKPVVSHAIRSHARSDVVIFGIKGFGIQDLKRIGIQHHPNQLGALVRNLAIDGTITLNGGSSFSLS